MRTPREAKDAADRIAILEKQKAQISERIARLERKAAEKARKEEVRLRLLVGEAALEVIKQNPEFRSAIEGALSRVASAQAWSFLASKGFLA